MSTTERVVALTGAGISTPSGIPDFRSANTGLWNFVDPMETASLWSFHAQPQRFYQWLQPLARSLVDAKPNPAHNALLQLERMGRLDAVITQNIDGLHQAAGSTQVVELHGHVRSLTCLNCGYGDSAESYLRAFLAKGELPRCPFCTSVLKPDAILFGEPLPEWEIVRAQELALRCDLMIVAGSSLKVMPAADLPALAKRRGARLIIVNMAGTAYDHLADVHL
ncbi:MAG: Sir2 family NAD-dependent protein deacetylase [Caldilineales bacterium]|nr:Sir2 family NAD-dependent protein deacetylase [Caldilineales bacterium]